MKVVACEKCGAKYQIDDNETIVGYECSVCAGDLKEIDEYPSTYSPLSQSHSNNLNKTPYNPNSIIVYCENCGLKHAIDKNEYLEDYECSSCFGNLRYTDENLNKKMEKRLKLRLNHVNSNSKVNNSSPPKTDSILTSTPQPINDSIFKVDEKSDSKSISKTSGISPIIETDISKTDQKLRKQLKKEFYGNLSSEYRTLDESNLKNENLKKEQKNQTIEDEIRKKLEEKNSKSSIFDKIAKNKTKGKEKDELHEHEAIDKEMAKLNNPLSVDGEIDPLINKNNKKHDLVPYPNITNTSYHDIYIIVGLIISLIGFLDIILSQRIYSIIFVAIGFTLFIIGIMKNKTHASTEKRGRIIRAKLLSLPENFYVLYFVKVPNSNDGINHVVVGASGIFSIVSQSYSEKEDKEKPKTEIENLELVNKSKLDNFDLLGISKIVEEANNNYENNKKKDKEKNIEKGSENNTEKNSENNTEKDEKKDNEKHPQKKEKKKLKIGRFKFRETPLKFEHNNKIKQKSIQLSEELINFLNENGLSKCYVEPLVGFVNNDVAVINMPLTDKDLFLDELLYRIVHGKRQLDDITTHKIAVLLSQYSSECSS